MDFVKKHYEKIVLGVVLLGLVGGLLLLPFVITHDRQQMEDMRSSIIGRSAKPLPPLDLSLESNALERVQSPYALDFETTNRLFNPVQWQRAVDGSLIKIKSGNEVGPGAVKVTNIQPLYFILTLDSVETNEFGARYVISVERQDSPVPALRRRQEHYVSVGEKNDVFALTGIKGPPENPSQLILQLAGGGGTVILSRDKPFQRVDGYAADLKYDPEGKKWDGQRIGADLKFYGSDYIIVAISQTEVVLSAASNQKKTTLTYRP